MAWLDSELTRQFYAWEARGRGWRIFPVPVVPEPPFRPFDGYSVSPPPNADDGREHTAFSSILSGIQKCFQAKSEEAVLEDAKEPEAEELLRDDLAEVQIILPVQAKVSSDIFARLLTNLSDCREPLAFEVLGTSEKILVQLAAHPQDADHVRRQVQAYFPEAVVLLASDNLSSAWYARDESETVVVEFGLEREFVLPLASDAGDLLVGLTAALSELQPDDVGLFQVIFQPLQYPWEESTLYSVTDRDNKPVFVNRPELVPAAQRKIAHPLYAAVVRLAAKSLEIDGAWELVRAMATSLGALAQPSGNELIPLPNTGYPSVDHAQDVIRRQSRRSGMILNRLELLSLVHLPTPAVRSPKLVRETGNSKAAPATVQQRGILLGHNLHAGQMTEVRLSNEERVRHTHIIGASGTGKTTLLYNLIRQDIVNGEGLAVLDPHGDLIEQILGIIPSHRINDVVLLDPSDDEYSIGFNILSARSELEKTLLASDLSSVFKRLSSSWGDQMHSVLSNAILAFLESSKGGTLSDMRRFLLDTSFREKYLSTVSDPEVVYYWRKSFPQLGGNKSIGPLMTRLETFLGPKPIRYMVSQKENRLDFTDIMDSGKIFLAKLPQGQIGRENSYLLGSLLMSKFQEQAMSRQSIGRGQRRPFWLYVDEFPNFISSSMAEILTGARKYNLGLILAHQELRQLQADADVAGAVLSNAGTRIVFRVGDADARTLAEGFSTFEADSLRKLGTGEAICRVERSDFDFNLTVPLLDDEPDFDQAEETRAQVITSSREKYGTPRAEIQAALLKQFETFAETETKPGVLEKTRAVEPSPPEPGIVPEVELVPTSEPPVVLAEPTSVVQRTPPPADMGRGGAQHQTIQKRLKGVADELGFLTTIEKSVLDGQGSVDLALEKEGYAIACEIAVTTTIDHEFGNVKKCVMAGFPIVAVISPKPERLSQIEEAVKAGLEPEDSARVGYFVPDQFIAWLRELSPTLTPPPPTTPTPAERTTRGYKVRRTAAKLTEEERQTKEDIALKAIARSMKKPRK
jgi:hypothetical protein